MSLACDVLGIGLNATDTLLLVEEFPAYAGKVPFHSEMFSPGGQVATAIVTCAKLGLRAKYIGTIGDDQRGNIQRQSLEGTGVDTTGVIVREGCANQTAYIIIDKSTGERTVLWQRPECLRLAPRDVNPEDIRSARMLHIDGYDTDAAAFAALVAHENRIPVSLDVDTVYPDFERVLRNVDYLIAGSNWPLKWTGESEPFRALAQLEREYRCRVTGMTLGREGALVIENGRWMYSAGYELTCVDTTGAGDAFHGAFCYAILAGMSIGPALDFSNAAAALNCTAIGARGHIPALDEIRAILAAAANNVLRRHSSAEIAGRLSEINSLAAVARQ